MSKLKILEEPRRSEGQKKRDEDEKKEKERPSSEGKSENKGVEKKKQQKKVYALLSQVPNQDQGKRWKT
jgi:hypothetical protein